MEIKGNLTFGKVRFDQETDTHLVLEIKAPAAAVTRPRLCVVPLIDVSPSMQGEKLEYAKQSLIKLIDHMSAQDYCGLIQFSATAQRVSKPVLCTPETKEMLKSKVRGLEVSGATNISDALLMGFEDANGMDLAGDVITRVILFTDGEANRGTAVRTSDIIALVEPNIGGSSLSAFGYGEGANSELLLGLSSKGNGNYSFVQNPDDALSAFGKELGGLLSTYATNLTVEVTPLSGHTITQVVSDVDAEEDLSEVSITIPDILSEETRHLVLAVKLSAQKNAFPRAVNVVDVKVGYDVLDSSLRKERKELELKAKVQFVKAAEAETKPDAELDRIVGLAQMVRAQIEADERAKAGDFSGAVNVMTTFSADAQSRGMIGLSSVASNIGAGLGSQVAYNSSQSYRSSMLRGVTRGVGGMYSDGATMDLMSLGVETSTRTQGTLSDEFSSGSVVYNGDPTNRIAGDPTNRIAGDISLWGGTSGTITTGVINATDIVTAPHVDPNVVVVSTSEKTEKKVAKKRKISQKTKRW
jgi:Ca-activated chloride channel homolog